MKLTKKLAYYSTYGLNVAAFPVTTVAVLGSIVVSIPILAVKAVAEVAEEAAASVSHFGGELYRKADTLGENLRKKILEESAEEPAAPEEPFIEALPV